MTKSARACPRYLGWGWMLMLKAAAARSYSHLSSQSEPRYLLWHNFLLWVTRLLRIKNYAHQNIMNFSLSAFVLGLKMMSHKLCEGTQLLRHISLVPPGFYIGQMECLTDRLNMVCCRLRRWAKYCPQSRLEQLAQLSTCLR